MQLPFIIETNLRFGSLEPRASTDLIVVHHSAISSDFSAAQIHQSHINIGYSGIGYHFLIRKNGDIERGRPLWAVGAHAYGFNFNSIGICIGGNFELTRPLPCQFDAAANLIAALAAKFNLPLDPRHIRPHCELNSTACPGKFLNLAALRDKAIFLSN